MNRIQILFFFCFALPITTFGQNTVGLINYIPAQSSSGYNLVYPHNQPTVFLLDNCGQLIHRWEDDADFRPGNIAYLMPDGDLIKAKRPSSFIGDAIWAGGGGATVERLSWNNTSKWTFTQNDSVNRLHHDIAPMPNGNVLMISWEKKSAAQAIEKGRDPAKLAEDELWPDYILEYNPNIDSIVWEWHAWDHLIQDFDATKNNFGDVTNHPELIDLNWDNHNGHPDWLHVNAIDYNEYLDQIAISVPYFDEIWIIDHSTTTTEAAGHSGGGYGRGGDLLYRWGNPITYTKDSELEQRLFFSHDIQWINSQATEEDPDFGKMVVFNNRLPNNTSSANIFLTPIDTENKKYTSNSEQIYGPEDFTRVITHPDSVVQASSSSVSSVQILPNGNALVCSGRWGFTYEITPENKVVWEYILPLQAGSPVSQGTDLSINDNFLFRLKRYQETYSAFDNRNLEPQGYLEFNPDPMVCDLATSTLNLSQEDAIIYPNPVNNYLHLSLSSDTPADILIYNMVGRLIIETKWSGQPLYLESLPTGAYIINIKAKRNIFSKFIKL